MFPRTEIEAWLAGMIATDGTISGKKTKTPILTQSFPGNSFKILSETFRKPIYHYKRRDGRQEFSIRFQEIPNDWKTSIPILSPELERHYIRGLFDGDGCISWNGSTKTARFLWHGSEQFLGDYFMNFLERNHILSNKLIGEKSNVWHCPVKARDVQKFLNLLYLDCSISIKRERALQL